MGHLEKIIFRIRYSFKFALSISLPFWFMLVCQDLRRQLESVGAKLHQFLASMESRLDCPSIPGFPGFAKCGHRALDYHDAGSFVPFDEMCTVGSFNHGGKFSAA